MVSGFFEPQVTFSSSGTTGQIRSQHHLRNLTTYESSFKLGFERCYGDVDEYCILALLPSYLEREGSSLVYMAKNMIEASRDGDSGFYLDNYDQLYAVLLQKIQSGQPTMLLGVSFALLDFAHAHQLPANDMVIMETGGMKGRRKEMIRTELHKHLCHGFGVKTIHSEYGMTELLSQAYAVENGRFRTPPWMKVFIRETDDPFTFARIGKTGGVNIIDLANQDSCAFIETQDLGRMYDDASFEIMGRFDNADIRGCNLMVI